MPKATRTTDITSFSDLRQNLRSSFDRVKKTNRPLFITTNGKPDAVILSSQAYDRLLADPDLAQSVASVARGMKQLAAGRGVSVDDGFATIDRARKARRPKSA